ncbi:MAG: DNA-deoxyinosine glycosylase, partial [Lentisphaeria bacterium]|nr:DNA-deoxyinosine glycosylase [Lentisphaeria bacterium]
MTSRCQSFPPSETPEARVLILGSMPGGESLRQHQYYAFRHNAFWRIAGTLFSFSPELPYEQRLAKLRACGVALWDVLAECEREGSLDTAIRSPDPNDIPGLLARCPKIELVCCNGSAAFNCLRRFFPKLPVPA